MHEAHTQSSRLPDQSHLRGELVTRRTRLVAAAARSPSSQLAELLEAVDNALRHLDHGDYGMCEVCDGPIESEYLAEDPLARVCLECLSPAQRAALEYDLRLASDIQRRLLPERHFETDGWEGSFHYEPHGPVSGDFYDVIRGVDDTLILLGDVSGKGVSAALLMSHLSAIFRGLAGSNMRLVDLMEQANRLFCASIPAGSYATLVAARLISNGEVELSNAGHVPPIIQNGRIEELPPDGVPLGLFSQSTYTSQRLRLRSGDRLVFVTDGLIESQDERGREYGLDSLSLLVESFPDQGPTDLLKRLVADVARFRGGRTAADDTTMMVIRRAA